VDHLLSKELLFWLQLQLDTHCLWVAHIVNGGLVVE